VVPEPSAAVYAAQPFISADLPLEEILAGDIFLSRRIEDILVWKKIVRRDLFAIWEN